jgi:NTE family protein
MLFHLGSLWRLNEAGYLPRLDRVSSVSGGSITAGLLAHRWSRLSFGSDRSVSNFEDEIVAPLRSLAGRRVDIPAIVVGLVLPGAIGNRVAASYRRHLFGEATLRELPDRPRFIFNATSLQSGALVRLSKPYFWEWRVGEVRDPEIPLATAVAASSAFPPFLSPVVLRFSHRDFIPGSGLDLSRPPYTTRVVVADGGVYDNLGLDPVWKHCRRVLISDGGGRMNPTPRPKRNWPLQSHRVLSMIDNQVRSLRKRDAIVGYMSDEREGTYWGIRTDITDYGLADSLPCPPEHTSELAALPTRLTALRTVVQERLVNWGYAVCDAALRRHVDPALPSPRSFPYEHAGVG